MMVPLGSFNVVVATAGFVFVGVVVEEVGEEVVVGIWVLEVLVVVRCD